MTHFERNASRRFAAGSIPEKQAGLAPVCLVICIILFWGSAASFAAEPLSFSESVSEQPNLTQTTPPALRLGFVANSKGSLFPCSTCSSLATGGISRRHFLISQMRQVSTPLLYIAGPYEFPPDAKEVDSVPENSSPLADPALHLALHNELGVDAGWLSPAATAWFSNSIGKLPKGYSPAKNSPETKLVNIAQSTIGLVFFPEITHQNAHLAQLIREECLKAGQALGARADFIIGISPWGMEAERDFLFSADGIFNLILGAGDGLGFAQAFDSRAPGVLWMRSDSLGRAMTILELNQPPASGHYPWIPGVTFTSRLLPLHPSTPTTPKIDAMIEELGGSLF